MSRRGDLLINVNDLLRQPGTRREVKRSFTAAGYSVAGSEVPAGTEVQIDLVVESTADPGTVTVTGTIEAPWVGECRRCLEEVRGDLSVQVNEVFSRTPSTEADEDVWPLEDDQIDLGQVVGENLLLSLPMAPLCGPDCRGPAPEEFPAQTAEEAEKRAAEDAAAEPRDPRWAALDDLRFD